MVLGSSHRKKKQSNVDKGLGISIFYFSDNQTMFSNDLSITQGV
jgi:hypothetical protein